ncbi:ABC transporter substrate-binding protein [Kutzneria sp. CA-103260]|uniref:ABC transporter substrate-binding protein n=1 Tax=Kutzneria sp. CA-103260 TaxID=2802641 RepID=UPI001BAB3499|nr:extracellular solute-binding protein [Kutzneria sp. CA-103260]QUQ63779.1 sugar ABC transporter substrate-binding protein [Kutzneria sp. CA-103260]
MRGGLIGLAAVLALVAACAPGPLETGDSDTGPVKVDFASFKGKHMTYLYFTDGPDLDATKAAIGRFEQATGATVDLQVVPFADLQRSLQARISGNTAPEVARVQDWHPYAGELLDFGDYFGKDYRGEFTDGAAATTVDSAGHMYAVPSDQTINGPFVNVDAFKKAGVPVPGGKFTWPQLVDAATRVAAANHMPSAMSIDISGNRLSTVLSQYGTALIGADGNEGLDQAKAEQALGMVNDLLQQGKLSKDFWLGAGTNYKGGNDAFLAGQAPVYLSGPWQIGAFAKSAPFAWAAVPNPCAAQCGGFPGGKMMVAFKHSKEPTLGAAFTQWMNRAENQREIDKTAYWLPTRKDLVSSGVQYPSRDADMNMYISQITTTPQVDFTTQASPAFTAAALALIKEFDKAVAGQESIADCVRNLKTQVAQIVQASK